MLKASVNGKVPEGWSCDKAVAYITGTAVGGAAGDYILKDKESLEGKVAVVVGASGSIGSAVLQWLALEKKIRGMAVCSCKKANYRKRPQRSTMSLTLLGAPRSRRLPRRSSAKVESLLPR